MNVHFSDILSMVLEPLASTIPGSWEVISVDDFISGCEDYNEEVEAAGGATLNKDKHTKKKPEAAGGAEVQGAEVGAGGGRNPKINREIKNLQGPR